MNTIKITAASLLMALALISCKNDSEKEAQVNENTDEVQTVKDSTVSEKERYADAGVNESLTDKPVMPDNYKINWNDVDADPKLKMDIDNWADLNTFSTSVKALDLKEVPQNEITDFVTELVNKANNLEKTIPQSLKTEEVMEDIKDIKEEVADLKMVIAKNGVDKNKIENQVEELMEAYDDLNEELKETASKNGTSLIDENQ